jgi:aspartyl-tRNA(Asn)/glutamyl-tRNA(Gln) amidotransferase subunit A
MIVLWQSGAAKLLSAYSEEQRRLVDPGLDAAARAGARFSAIDYVAADVARTELGRVMGLFHQRYDLLLTPTVAVPALPVGTDLSDPSREEQWIDWTPFSYPFNMTRQPAATVPCGFVRGDRPVGLQIVGGMYQDALVLRAARAFESARPQSRHPEL